MSFGDTSFASVHRNLEGAGTDCPYVPKNESPRKTTSPEGQRALEGTEEKKRVYHLLKEDQVSQEMLKGVARACRKKLQRQKLS